MVNSGTVHSAGSLDREMIKAIIFDMDGTLYASDKIRKQFAGAAYHTLSKTGHISIVRAQKLIEERRAALQEKSGFPVPYTLTLRSFNIPISVWHEENIRFFDPRDYLRKDDQLKRALTALKNDFRLAVMTNNNRVQTERVLEALALSDIFDRVFTYNSFEVLKPDPAFFEKSATALDIDPQSCLFVGDRYDVDLQPARKLGMQVLEVKGPEDIYVLAGKISKKRE
jgi:putative hydrolase of the HAD superfamily